LRGQLVGAVRGIDHRLEHAAVLVVQRPQPAREAVDGIGDEAERFATVSQLVTDRGGDGRGALACLPAHPCLW